MKRVTIYVTDEQYKFLKHLKKQKVSMSTFLRGLLAMYLSGPRTSPVVAEEVTVYRKRRVVMPGNRVNGDLRRKLMNELKAVLAKRKIKG